MNLLCSGLIGALAAQILIKVFDMLKRRNEFRNLLVSILAESNYNLSIVDEITAGSISGISFKRLSVEYFGDVHKEVMKYTYDYNLLLLLSRVAIDMELFNREVEENAKRKCQKQNSIDDVVVAARQGVSVSLRAIKKHIEEKYGMEAHDYE